MEITRNNYERFFLDYFEANLEAEMESALLDFLDRNPDLKDELDSFEKLQLEGGTMGLTEKTKLYKPEKINPANEDSFFIAFHESDLNSIQKSELEKYLSEHPEKVKSMEAFGRLKLKPEESLFDPAALYQPNDLALNEQMELVAVIEGEKNFNDVASIIAKPNGETTLGLLQKTKLHADLALRFPGKRKLKKGESLVLYLRPALAAAAAIILFFLVPIFFQDDTDVAITNIPIEKSKEKTLEIVLNEATPELVENVPLKDNFISKEKVNAMQIHQDSQKEIIKSAVPAPIAQKNDFAVAEELQIDSVPSISPISIPELENFAHVDAAFDTLRSSVPVVHDLEITDESLAEKMNENEHVPTVLEYVVNEVSEATIKETIIDKNKLNGELLAQGLSKKTPWIDYKSSKETEDEYSRLTVSVGKFQFKRSKKRH